MTAPSLDPQIARCVNAEREAEERIAIARAHCDMPALRAAIHARNEATFQKFLARAASINLHGIGGRRWTL